LFFLSFLQTVSQVWKDTYILTYVATSPPFVGAFTAVQALVFEPSQLSHLYYILIILFLFIQTSGYNFGIPYLLPATAKEVQRTFGMPEREGRFGE
jgi:Lecithin:cholesterol acyltransferase